MHADPCPIDTSNLATPYHVLAKTLVRLLPPPAGRLITGRRDPRRIHSRRISVDHAALSRFQHAETRSGDHPRPKFRRSCAGNPGWTAKIGLLQAVLRARSRALIVRFRLQEGRPPPGRAAPAAPRTGQAIPVSRSRSLCLESGSMTVERFLQALRVPSTSVK